MLDPSLMEPRKSVVLRDMREMTMKNGQEPEETGHDICLHGFLVTNDLDATSIKHDESTDQETGHGLQVYRRPRSSAKSVIEEIEVANCSFGIIGPEVDASERWHS